MKRMLIIYNPYSGKAVFKNKLSDVVDYYTKNGYTTTVHSTQGSKDATKVIEENSKDYDVIVFSGGDGTLNEVVNGLISLENPPTIGYIPSGTSNDFSASLNLSKDIMTAAKTVVNGNPFACDIGTFNGNAFSYIVAFGLFTDVSYQTPQDRKNVLGRMAYILEGAKRLENIPSFTITVTTENETITDKFVYGMVTNSLSVGGFKGITGENVKLDDGLFEVTLAKKPNNIAEIQSLLQCVLTKNFNEKHFYSFKASKIEFQSITPLDWTVDGEFGDTTNKVVIENIKQAIKVYVD